MHVLSARVPDLSIPRIRIGNVVGVNDYSFVRTQEIEENCSKLVEFLSIWCENEVKLQSESYQLLSFLRLVTCN